MEQLNRVELRGTVGSCRLQKVNERMVVNMSVVTSFAFKDKDGGAVIEDQWHNVSAWEGKNVKDLEHISKGSKVYVEGRLRSRIYTSPEGEEKTIHEILANKINLLNVEENLQYEMS